MLKLGCHVSMSSPDYVLGSVREALSYNATALMLYTGAPQNSFRMPLEKMKITEGTELWKNSGYETSSIIVHAPYIINLANLENENTREMGMKLLASEIQRTAAIKARYLVLHPGASLKADVNESIEMLARCLNEVLPDSDDVIVCLETMAGKGSEIGRTFQQIAQIISLVNRPLGVCLDSCHINDAGYDLSDTDGVISEFDRVIGLNKLHVVHVNDSKNPLASHKDRHANIGQGTIGLDNLGRLVHHPLLADQVFILETPYCDGVPVYAKEIEMLRNYGI